MQTPSFKKQHLICHNLLQLNIFYKLTDVDNLTS